MIRLCDPAENAIHELPGGAVELGGRRMLILLSLVLLGVVFFLTIQAQRLHYTGSKQLAAGEKLWNELESNAEILRQQDQHGDPHARVRLYELVKTQDKYRLLNAPYYELINRANHLYGAAFVLLVLAMGLPFAKCGRVPDPRRPRTAYDDEDIESGKEDSVSSNPPKKANWGRKTLLVLGSLIGGLIVSGFLIPNLFARRQQYVEEVPGYSQLKLLLFLQKSYHSQHGEYASSLSTLPTSCGKTPWNHASLLYISIYKVSGRPLDWKSAFAVCAIPAIYGNTGIFTYAIDQTGVVWMKDTGGRPVTDWAEVEDGTWVVP